MQRYLLFLLMTICLPATMALGLNANWVDAAPPASAPAGEIHGCIKSGTLTVVSSDAYCTSIGGAPIDWNAEGPSGPTGPAGPTGPTGPRARHARSTCPS